MTLQLLLHALLFLENMMGCFGLSKVTPKGDFFFPHPGELSVRQTISLRHTVYQGATIQKQHACSTLFNVISLSEFHRRGSKWLFWLDVLVNGYWGKEGNRGTVDS